MTTGQKLEQWLKSNGLMKGFIAVQLGIDRSTLTRWLNDETAVPRAKWQQIENLARLYPIPLPRDMWEGK